MKIINFNLIEAFRLAALRLTICGVVTYGTTVFAQQPLFNETPTAQAVLADSKKPAVSLATPIDLLRVVHSLMNLQHAITSKQLIELVGGEVREFIAHPRLDEIFEEFKLPELEYLFDEPNTNFGYIAKDNIITSFRFSLKFDGPPKLNYCVTYDDLLKIFGEFSELQASPIPHYKVPQPYFPSMGRYAGFHMYYQPTGIYESQRIALWIDRIGCLRNLKFRGMLKGQL